MMNGPNHINFLVRGTDDPTLIFVHGFACSLDDWEEQFRGLSPRFRCVALDLPGHGNSAKPETISIEMMGSAVNRVKDRIAARSTILVGHSMGCRVIVDAFQQSGDTVSGLVFVDGSFLDGDLQSAMKNVKAAIDRAGMDAFTQRFFSDMVLESGDLELRERLITRTQALDASFREGGRGPLGCNQAPRVAETNQRPHTRLTIHLYGLRSEACIPCSGHDYSVDECCSEFGAEFLREGHSQGGAYNDD